MPPTKRARRGNAGLKPQTDTKKDEKTGEKNTCKAIVVRKEEQVFVPGVEAGASGKGWPFAPEAWPLPGDVWGWRAGRRTRGRFWHDRYMYLPQRLRTPGSPAFFHSKVKVQSYLAENFPDFDALAFFNSFHWRIPCAADAASPGTVAEKQEDSIRRALRRTCKLGNAKCGSMIRKNKNSKTMNCDICCTEPRFCRECSCILCGKITNQSPEEYGSIKCESKLSEEFTCGHVAHLECALRCNMAGVVKSIELDVEYYCRRCDNKTDLMMHVTALIQQSQSLGARTDIENSLKLALWMVQGTQRIGGRNLQIALELSLDKICSGMKLKDIAGLQEMTKILHEEKPNEQGSENLLEPLNVSPVSCVHSQAMTDGLDTEAKTKKRDDLKDLKAAIHARALNFENNISQALVALQRSQQMEYRLAKGKLDAQKDVVLSLFKKIELDTSGTLLDSSDKIGRLQMEVEKFNQMLTISNGFGSTNSDTLRYFFGNRIE